MSIPYALLADFLAGIHLLYVLFVVGGEALILIGGFARWSWIRSLAFRITHLLAIAFVAVNDLLGNLCPLTIWEYRLREAAGQQAEWDITFVGRLFRAVIYHDLPVWAYSLLYVGFSLLVVLTLIIFPPRRRQIR